jgi:predicted nucleic-acid-binding Zn-ribbon protein
MRSTQTCPKCAGRKFILSALRLDINSRFPAVIVAVDPRRLGKLMGVHTSEEYGGSFETWICPRCRYTELYACGDPRSARQAAPRCRAA